MITGRQLKAARALLGIDATQLAAEAELNAATIGNFENNLRHPHKASLARIVHVLEQKGIEFTDNQGVCLKSNDIEVFKGPERFHDFTEFVYEHLERFGGAVCISAVDEKLFRKYRKDFELYRRRMAELVTGGKVTVRILATESHFTSTWATYKWQPQQSAAPISFYAFGDCLALISFAHEPPPHVVLLKSSPFAEAYRHAFDLAWNAAEEPPTRGRK